MVWLCVGSEEEPLVWLAVGSLLFKPLLNWIQPGTGATLGPGTGQTGEWRCLQTVLLVYLSHEQVDVPTRY